MGKKAKLSGSRYNDLHMLTLQYVCLVYLTTSLNRQFVIWGHVYFTLIIISDFLGRETQLLARSGSLLKHRRTQTYGLRFTKMREFRTNFKNNLIFPVPEYSVNQGRVNLRTRLLIFELSDPTLQTDFGGTVPRGNAHTTSYHHWQLTSGWTLATNNTQIKKPKRQFRVANFVWSLLKGRSAAQHWGTRLSHQHSASPLSDTSVQPRWMLWRTLK
jgi:hypothetical protein